MTTRSLAAIGVLVTILFTAGDEVAAATLYVSQTSTNPTPPYATWDTAAHTIQEAVDAASDGDTVLVAAGEYRLTNQVSIAKAILLRSDLGREQTSIHGQDDFGGPKRCLWISDPGATVDGFTLRNGNGTPEGGGGVYLVGGTVKNCTIQSCYTWPEGPAGGVAMIGGMLSNCIVKFTPIGIAVSCSSGGLITDCQIVDNRFASANGGLYLTGSELKNSIISWNRGFGSGAGVNAISSRIVNCTITNNHSFVFGGGAYLDECEMDRCIIAGNRASQFQSSCHGGGIFATNSMIRNSLIVSNFTSGSSLGGGVYLQESRVLNCTVAGNQASEAGGIYVESGSVWNSIAYFNSAPSDANWFSPGGGSFHYCCTTPNPGPAVLGNIVEDPQFLDRTNGNYRLGPTSPCIDAGFNQEWMTAAYDLDGNTRIRNGTVDIGAYETSDVPVIFTHPQSQAAANGSDVTFRVTATGAPPLTYQWRKYGVAIPGATSSAMTLFNVTDADEGTYSVMLSNQFGTAVSSNALLTVITVPVVTWVAPAQGESFPAGSDIPLRARATDADGSVSYVEFYANGRKLGQVISSTDAYDFVWSNAPSGTFQLHAEAVDNDSARGLSGSVQIVVGAPSVTLIEPASTFGSRVAISGTRVVVGEQDRIGRAYVYDRASATPTIPVAILDNPDPDTLQFSWSVALSDTWVVVGVYQGQHAYVYDLTSPTPTEPVFTLNNPGLAGGFGNAVAISGARVVVGARLDDTGATDAGAVYVYDLASATPTEPVAKLTNPTPAQNDWFGASVAISGTHLIVGAYQDNTGASDAGSAYVFDVAGAAPAPPVLILTLNNPSPSQFDRFGFDVAVSDTRIVVGEWASGGAGSAYVYDLASNTPSAPTFTLNYPACCDFRIGHVAISGSRVVVGNTVGANAGITSIFDLASPTPAEPIATLNNPDPTANVWFGFRVGISGAQLVVGAPKESGGNGRAYLYDLASPP